VEGDSVSLLLVRLFSLFVIGTVGFVLISYFEQLPVLGWLGAMVSVVALGDTRTRARARGRVRDADLRSHRRLDRIRRRF
jgi:hypothetical protein